TADEDNLAGVGVDLDLADMAAIGKTWHVRGEAPTPCRPTPSSEGRPTGMNDICETWAIGIDRSVPAIVKAPSAKAMSAVSAFRKCAAKRLLRSMTSSAAARNALPPIIVLREP